MKTLVIIPAYNEAENIVGVVESIKAKGFDYVVINDGSYDNTVEVCKTNDIHLLDLAENLGIGGAIQAGHKYALRHGYDVDVQFDGDGQHEADHIQDLLNELTSNDTDIAVGSRFLVATDGFRSSRMRRVGIKWLSFWIKLFSGERITDPTSGFRACNKKAIELFARDYPIDYPEPESLVNALKKKLAVREIPVLMHERKKGSSSIKPLSSVYYMIKVSLAIAIIGFSK